MTNITINIRSLVPETSSNLSGTILFKELHRALNNGSIVILEVDNDLALSSSFLNSSIGEILDKYGLSTFKRNVKFKGNKNQFERIATYISYYEKLASA
jgi:L-2-hydroxyglutarate oxidase LhgO